MRFMIAMIVGKTEDNNKLVEVFNKSDKNANYANLCVAEIPTVWRLFPQKPGTLHTESEGQDDKGKNKNKLTN